eukprot:3326015-Rhodomonas_salina.1
MKTWVWRATQRWLSLRVSRSFCNGFNGCSPSSSREEAVPPREEPCCCWLFALESRRTACKRRIPTSAPRVGIHDTLWAVVSDYNCTGSEVFCIVSRCASE